MIRGLPGYEPPFDEADQHVQGEGENHQTEDSKQNERNIVVGARDQDQVAEPRLGGDVLPNHGTDQSKADIQFSGSHHPAIRRWDYDLREDLEFGSAERLEELD